jgi:uncharacterized protein (TIGR02147 family)
MTPTIFDFTNYRDFLKAFYAAKKAERNSFSYQAMAQRAGFKSKASFANIISGVQSLSNNTILNIARALCLGKKETDYFEAMVHFNNAATPEEKSRCFERMRTLTPKNEGTLLVESQYDFYSQWYHCVLRELVVTDGFRDDFAQLAKRVVPAITPAQARKSVELLVKLGMIERKADGTYRQVEPVMTTVDEVASLALQNYHREYLRLAAEAISRIDRSDRETSSVTMGISKRGFRKVKNEIQQFRKRLLEIAAEETSTEAVYQVAFQAFPTSKLPKDWRD